MGGDAGGLGGLGGVGGEVGGEVGGNASGADSATGDTGGSRIGGSAWGAGDGSGVLEAVALLVGMRHVEVRNKAILLNGIPLLIKGVNRHEHDPYTGHVISRRSMRRDIAAMKRLHLNAIRTSHYPNDPYLYLLADRYGMYVVDEANIESHGSVGP